MYPYDYRNSGEYHHRYPEEHQHHRQPYAEGQQYGYPHHQHPPYCDHESGFPPSQYPPMPPQFGPPGHLPHAGSMGHPEPYAGSFYPSMRPPPPPYQGPYPPVSSVGPINPSAYPPVYPPTQEYSHLSAHEYPPASVPYPSSYRPTQEATYASVPERLSGRYPPPPYLQTQEDTHSSVPERHDSLRNPTLYSSTQEDTYTSIVTPQLASSSPPRLSDVDLPKGSLVRIFCKANNIFNLAVQDDRVVMAPANVQDDAQLWIKDGKYGIRIKDMYGQPAFILVNKASKKVLKHANGQEQPVQLLDYSPDIDDDNVLWTESQDFGEGFKTVRMVSNTLLNITVFNGDSNRGGVRHGSPIVLDTWHKKDHQLWKIFPL